MIHADKKSAGRWNDMPIPFPVEEKHEFGIKADISGVSQIPSNLRGAIYREK